MEKLDPANENSQTQEQPDEWVLTLRKPVIIGDQAYETLNLREPTAAEFDKLAKTVASNPTGSVLALIATISGIAPPIIGKIGVSDFNRASDYLMGFINSGRKTQTTSSQD